MQPISHPEGTDSFGRLSDEFLAWLARQPGVRISPKIQIADLRVQGAGRGVVAKTEILEDEELFAIPRKTVLTVQNSKLTSLLSHDLDELGPWLSLMLVMIYEYLLQEKSTWFPYFRVLPSQFDTLMFWSNEELAELQGSAVVDKIGKQGAEEAILESIAPIVRSNPALFPPPPGLSSYEGAPGTAALLNLAHVMGSLIMAYAFDIEKAEDENDDEQDGEDGYLTDEEEGQQLPKGMVPLADLLNADADRNNEEEFLVMKTIKPIAAGEELFNDYGELPRSDLLRRYGYITDNYAKYDVVELSLDCICQAAGLANDDIDDQPHLGLLEENSVLEDGYILPRLSDSDSLDRVLPSELGLLLKTLTLPAEIIRQRRAEGSLPKLSPLSAKEASILRAALGKLQSRYKTTLSEDFRILSQLKSADDHASTDASARRRMMAVLVRIGEKEIIQTWIDHLDKLTESTKKRSGQHVSDDSRRSKVQRT